MATRRDYVPSREKNLCERMKQGESVKDGLAGRVTVQKDGAHYRKYFEKGGENKAKKYLGTNDGGNW